MAKTEDDDLSGAYDPYTPVEDNWLNHTLENISACASDWGLQVGDEMKAGLVGYLVEVQLDNGRPGVLKLREPGYLMEAEVAALENFAGNGTVRMLHNDLQRGALLLERIEPGTTLGDSENVDIDTAMLGVLERLSNTPASGTLRSAVEQLHKWADALDNPPDSSPLSAAQFRRNAGALRELAKIQSADNGHTVHGDLHIGNVILGDSNEWLAVDPKGFAATPLFDAAWWLRDPPRLAERNTTQALRHRLDSLSELGFERSALLDFGRGLCAVLVLARTRMDILLDAQRHAVWASIFDEVS